MRQRIPWFTGNTNALVSCKKAQFGSPYLKSKDYAILLKPRVMSLVVFTGVSGLLLAPGAVDPVTAILATIFIAVGAGAAGAINMWYDRDIDLQMERTAKRPIPDGRIVPYHALIYGTGLSICSIISMGLIINWTAAFLLALTISYYVFVYTIWLKRRTSHNIVVGGGAGALPPVIGWAAATGAVNLEAIVLFMIIFIWTPPHFWSLSLYCRGDYEKAGIPMLPVVAGIKTTKRYIMIYSVILVPVTLLPFLIGMSSWVYGIFASLLGVWLLRHAMIVWQDKNGKAGRMMFFFTIFYLFLIFLALLIDRITNFYFFSP